MKWQQSPSTSSIGRWVARAVADPRTLGRSVVVWEDEVALGDAFALAARVSGEGDALAAERGKASPSRR